jgi:hypothetical protein
MNAVPFHVSTGINIKPTVITFPVAAGWTEKKSDPIPAFRDKQSVEKYASQTNDNGKLLWSVKSGLEASWSRWSQEEENRLKTSHPDGVEQTMKIGEYTGPLYIETKEISPHERSIYVYGLLHKGQAGMSIFYYMQGWGAEITEDGTKVYDGVEDMSKNMNIIQEEINGMYQATTSTMAQ